MAVTKSPGKPVRRIRRPKEDKLIIVLDRFIKVLGYTLVAVFLSGLITHFYKAGGIRKGWNEIMFMGKFYQSDEDMKEMVFRSYEELEHEYRMLNSLDAYHRDSLYATIHNIFGKYLDPRSKLAVMHIVERQDLGLLEKIKIAEEDLTKDIVFPERERELFLEKFAEIAKLFFIFSDEGNLEKLRACSHIITLESFNPMYHYYSIRSIIEFAFNFADEHSLGYLAKELLLDRAYSDHEMQDWELRGFHQLQATEVDSAFHVFMKYVDIKMANPTPENKDAAYLLIQNFMNQLNENDFGVFQKEYPSEVEFVLVNNLHDLYIHLYEVADQPSQKLFAFKTLMEIGHFDVRFFNKYKDMFSLFLDSCRPLPRPQRIKLYMLMKSELEGLHMDVSKINRQHYLTVLDDYVKSQ